MKWTCNFSVGPAQIGIVFANDTNIAITYVLHASTKGARKYILEYLDSRKSDLDAMGKIWFFNHEMTWEQIRPIIAQMLENF